MIKQFLHQIVAHPRVYDLVQTILGSKTSRKRLVKQIGSVDRSALVVDVGGGTGLNQELLPEGVGYVCVDNDPMKLLGLMSKQSSSIPILGTGTQLPIKANSVEIVLCTAVSHHISDDLITNLNSEMMRILTPNGKLIFLDALMDPWHPTGRLLWRYDRGAFPRTADVQRDLLSQFGDIIHWEEYRIFHRYLLAVVTPKSS